MVKCFILYNMKLIYKDKVSVCIKERKGKEFLSSVLFVCIYKERRGSVIATQAESRTV